MGLNVFEVGLDGVDVGVVGGEGGVFGDGRGGLWIFRPFSILFLKFN